MPFDNTSQFTTETNGGARCSAEHVTSVIVSRVYTSCYFMILLNLLQEKKGVANVCVTHHVTCECILSFHFTTRFTTGTNGTTQRRTCYISLDVKCECIMLFHNTTKFTTGTHGGAPRSTEHVSLLLSRSSRHTKLSKVISQHYQIYYRDTQRRTLQHRTCHASHVTND